MRAVSRGLGTVRIVHGEILLRRKLAYCRLGNKTCFGAGGFCRTVSTSKDIVELLFSRP